jgi:hypothetical protein
MINSSILRHCLCALLAVALTSCGESGVGPRGSAENGALERPAAQSMRFTGAVQHFTVPAGVHSIRVQAFGAAGAGPGCIGIEQRGGRVDAVIPVTPGKHLVVYVGGASSSRDGGFNGGGEGGLSSSGGGGGASDIRVNPGRLRNRILVAGGGGGQGGGDFVSGLYGGCGGGGGGLVGGSGESGGGPTCVDFAGQGGSGGSQSAGGAGGAGGTTGQGCPIPCRHAGRRGDRGAPGAGGSGGGTMYTGGGGGGGGGYFGGGGGGSTCANDNRSSISLQGGGGGGGSSYAEPSATNVRYTQNAKRAVGNGLVIFSWQ